MYVLLPVSSERVCQLKRKIERGPPWRTYTQLCGITGVESLHGALNQSWILMKRLGDVDGKVSYGMLVMRSQGSGISAPD